MTRPGADRNLLFGILALQMDFITRDSLVGAMNAWALEKHRTLGEILVDRGSLDPKARSLLDPMVDLHVARHGGDPSASLAALSSVEAVASDLRRGVRDTDLLESLATVAPGRLDDPLATRLDAPGASPAGSRYRRGHEHARGNLGVVFVARDTELNREVALKEIQDRHADHPHHRSRFLLEAEVTGGLEHPGIVPVYGLGHHEDGRPFYAMRFVRGDSLLESIRRFHAEEGHRADPGLRNLALQKLLRRFVDVCNAVEYAHSRGVLHRDLKPHNVMVGKYGETLVVDWGLAKATGQSGEFSGDDALPEELLRPSTASGPDATMPGALVGTPAYMSPEQASGRLDLLGPASDVYGLGATLYHILAGRPPFGGPDIAGVLQQVRAGDLLSPRLASPWLGPALGAICLKAMALRPEARYPSPRALADDLERWIADEPVLAWREPRSQRVARWARRNRSWVAAGAGALVLVSVVSVLAAAVIEGARRDARASLARERASRLAESAARLEAGRRLAQARESIDTLLTGVGEGLSKIPGAQKVRRQLLEKAATQYRRLADEGGNDPALRLESGSAHARLGSIRERLGDFAGAEADFRAAEAVLGGGPALAVGDPQAGLVLVQARAGLGLALKNQGRLDDAERAYRRAVDDGQGLLKARPDDPKVSLALGMARAFLASMLAESRRTAEAEALYGSAVPALEAASKLDDFRPIDQLARALNSHALLLQGVGRVEEAEARFRASIDAASESLRRFPEEFEGRTQLALARRNLGALLVLLGRSEEAERSYLASLADREELARSNPDVPDYRFFLASSRAALGNFYKERVRYREAEGSIRAAIVDLEALVRAHPGDQNYRNRLGNVRAAFGALLMAMGRFPEAEAEVRQANDQLRTLWAANPKVPLYGANLGNGLNNLGRILRRLGRFDDAEAAFRDGLATCDRLAVEQPAVASHRDMQALISNNIAGLLAQRSRFEPALPMARRAVAGYEVLSRDDSKVLDYPESLAMSRITLGGILINLGREDEAREVMTAAVAVASALVASHPEVPLFVQRLIEGRAGLAEADSKLGRHDEALAAMEAAAATLRDAVARHPDSSDFRGKVWEVGTARAEILLSLGRPSDAVAGLDALCDEPCPEGIMAYNAARLYARAGASADSPARGHARDRAVDLIRKAVGLGFRDFGRIAGEDDLEPLRSRPDFQLLVLDAAFPAELFAR